MRIAILLASHALLFGAGWLAFRDSGERSVADNPAVSPRDRRNREAEREEGRRLVKEMREAWGTKAEAESAADYRAEQAQKAGKPSSDSRDLVTREFEKIRKLSTGMVLPADPVAEVKRLREGDSRALAAFLVTWLRDDGKAALAYLESDPEMQRGSASPFAFTLWVRDCGPEEVLDLVEGNAKLQGILAGFVMEEAAARDPASLGDLMERMEGWMDRKTMLRRAFNVELPAGKREAAVEWIKTNLKGKEAGDSIMQIARGIEDKGAAKDFLKASIAGGLDAAVVEQLKSAGNYHEIMRSGVGPDSPLDERIEVIVGAGIEGKTAAEKEVNAMKRIVAEDVGRWMRESFLCRSLKSGDIGAEELWSQLEAALPQFSDAAGRDAMLKAFIGESSLSDPEGAAALMKKEGKESEIGAYFFESIEDGFSRDQEASIRLASMIPAGVLRENLARYDGFYSQAIKNTAEKYGSFWTEWIQRQPAGLNRDLVMYHTASYLAKAGKEAEAASLRSLILDPSIKERPLR